MKRILLHLLVIAAPVAVLCNPIEPYSADKHAEGIKEILAQTVPDDSPFLPGTSYSYLVGNADHILGKLSTAQYTGYVTCENGVVEGFICYHITEAKPNHPFVKQKCLYVDWIATRLGHQRKGLGTLFSAQIRHDANHHQLPVMLNTLTNNDATQNWCAKYGLEYVGEQGILKYYLWRQQQEINQPTVEKNGERQRTSTPSASVLRPCLRAWLHTNRSKFLFGAACAIGAALFIRYGYNKRTMSSHFSTVRLGTVS